MKFNFRSKSSILAVAALLSVSLASCGSSSDAPEDLAVRASNCSLIGDWKNHRDDPSLKTFWGSKNSYEYYEEAENYMWQKLRQGDGSYDALIQLRALQYGQDWFIPPTPGEYITQDEYERYSSKTDPQDEETSWSIIKNVVKFCDNYKENEIAAEFAAALLM